MIELIVTNSVTFFGINCNKCCNPLYSILYIVSLYIKILSKVVREILFYLPLFYSRGVWGDLLVTQFVTINWSCYD